MEPIADLTTLFKYFVQNRDVLDSGENSWFGRAAQEAYTRDRYHQPADEFDPNWDLSGMVQQAQFTLNLGRMIADAPAMPAWNGQPPASEFGGTGDIPRNIRQSDWINLMKNNGCVGCHQLGQLSTRTLPPAFASLSGSAAVSAAALPAGSCVAINATELA